MNQKVAFSRVVIDRKLREAGWDIEDNSQKLIDLYTQNIQSKLVEVWGA